MECDRCGERTNTRRTCRRPYMANPIMACDPCKKATEMWDDANFRGESKVYIMRPKERNAAFTLPPAE